MQRPHPSICQVSLVSFLAATTHFCLQLSSTRLLGNYMSLAHHKSTQTGSVGAIRFQLVCGAVTQLLLKYCIYCVSAPTLHRESTDSLIYTYSCQFQIYGTKLHSVTDISTQTGTCGRRKVGWQNYPLDSKLYIHNYVVLCRNEDYSSALLLNFHFGWGCTSQTHSIFTHL